jgi:hypothetical protein
MPDVPGDPVPAALLATTVKLYCVPPLRPVIVVLSVLAPTVVGVRKVAPTCGVMV